MSVRATWAIDLVEQHLGMLPTTDGGIVRLVQFAHDSPGLRKYKRQLAESLVYLLESNGGTLIQSPSEAVELLKADGYTVYRRDKKNPLSA